MTDLSAIASLLDGVRSDVRELALETADLFATNPPGQSSDLAALRPGIHEVLHDHPDLVIAVGIALTPHLLSDQSHFLECWWNRNDRAAELLRVNLDPSAPDFYDYTRADWYASPQRTALPHIAGPYVGNACTNAYILTLAHPVETSEGVSAVVAADVPIELFEERALPLLLGLGPSVVTNGRGRVILSTRPEVAPGARWPVTDLPLKDPAHGGWQLIRGR